MATLSKTIKDEDVLEVAKFLGFRATPQNRPDYNAEKEFDNALSYIYEKLIETPLKQAYRRIILHNPELVEKVDELVKAKLSGE